MASKTKYCTFTLSKAVADMLENHIKKCDRPNKSIFVESAIVEKLKRMED